MTSSPPTLPVYSEYSHLSNFGSIAFAVGLRGDETGAADMIHRIMPLSKIMPPLQKSPQKTKKPKAMNIAKLEEDDAVCLKPECVNRREKLQDMHRYTYMYIYKFLLTFIYM